MTIHVLHPKNKLVQHEYIRGSVFLSVEVTCSHIFPQTLQVYMFMLYHNEHHRIFQEKSQHIDAKKERRI